MDSSVGPSAVLPVVAMDEAGNTGENLLDRQQPIYTLAAVSIDAATADALVDAALARTQMGELKFAALRRSCGGRRNIISLLGEADLGPDAVCVIAVDKAWMLAGKLVDELVEPRMLAIGRQMDWYASGEAFRMADTLYERGEAVLGESYRRLADTFVRLVRDYDTSRGELFLEALTAARAAAQDERTSQILGLMLDTPQALKAEFETRADALDPALACFGWRAGEWSERLGGFACLHDDAPTVERWAHELVMVRRKGQSEIPLDRRRVQLGAVNVVLPYGLGGISFSESHRDPRLQLADIFAGAGAYVYAALCGRQPEDGFSRELERQGIGSLIQFDIGPSLPRERSGRIASRAYGDRRR